MIEVQHEDGPALLAWFGDERPGPQTVAAHVQGTGVGRWWVDRWPDPRTVLVGSGGNFSLRGRPDAVTAEDLRPLVTGIVDAPAEFADLLRAVSPQFNVWPRKIYELADDWPGPADPGGVAVRPLRPSDAAALDDLDPKMSWIADTWGGPVGLAASGYAWGAFVVDRLASVACSFFVGRRYEDIGVVTAPGLQRRNLSTMCASALCVDILARGHRPTWSTSDDNVASLRVAGKVGFRHVRDDVLYVVGMAVPVD